MLNYSSILFKDGGHICLSCT